MDFCASRQPILDADNQLFAYELLLRDSFETVLPADSIDEAASRMVEGFQINLGIETYTESKPGFIKFTHETLTQGYARLFDPGAIVVELLGTESASDDLLTVVSELKQAGYRFTLDEFEDITEWERFIPLIDYVKFDIKKRSVEEIASIKDGLAGHEHLEFLAEKVETRQEFEQYKKLGIHYFQGYYFAKPEVVAAKSLSPLQTGLLELMAAVSADNFEADKVTQLLERDLNLSFKLLRYTNSAAFKRAADISSIHQAVVFLGQAEVKRFVALLFAAQSAEGKPEVLVKMAMIRARFFELLSENAVKSDKSTAYLTGLMSLIDAILDQPLDKILDQLPLSKDINRALLKGRGALADFVALANAYEKGEWESGQMLEDKLSLEEELSYLLYRDAVNWADQQLAAMQAA